ncbi:hypothetical protein acsn021_22090 [Anaerocolumna cellulosilytica]|uniref:Uncharacterized protein n=1 Tax=Anaerocolumna cellulosilytica TaxID=433286 RepID=A0A6S6R5E7_9FIRM|nr:hypothetical protein [Anaerocolumna cellulosilytica]BCJ94640.1 hypothetical protein acsn021_22090 [Anaerocolumna cellulosilytica]
MFSHTAWLERTRVTVESSDISIGQAAFADCNKLIDIDLPKSLKAIDSTVFSNTHWIKQNTCNQIQIKYRLPYLQELIKFM